MILLFRSFDYRDWAQDSENLPAPSRSRLGWTRGLDCPPLDIRQPSGNSTLLEGKQAEMSPAAEPHAPIALAQGRPWLVLRHIEHEHIGTLAQVLEGAGIAYRYLDVFRGDVVPETPADWSGLIVMGGPMGVYEADRYPFLREEQRLIRQATEEIGRAHV